MTDLASVLAILGAQINSIAPIIIVVMPMQPSANPGATNSAGSRQPSRTRGASNSRAAGGRILTEFLGWLDHLPADQAPVPARSKTLFALYDARCRKAGAERLSHQAFAQALTKDARFGIVRKRYRTSSGALEQRSVAQRRGCGPLPPGELGMIELGRLLERADALAGGLLA